MSKPDFEEKARERRRLEDEEQARRKRLLRDVESVALDFQHAPEQLGYYVAELEERGLLKPREVEQIFWHLVELAGFDFAKEALGAKTIRHKQQRNALAEQVVAEWKSEARRSRARMTARAAQNAGAQPGASLEVAEEALERVVLDDDVARGADTRRLVDDLSPQVGLGDQPVTVRVDAEADARTRREGADGLAEGRNIYLRPSAYDPSTQAGRELLAHEVLHVAQPRYSGPEELADQAWQAAEAEAEQLGRGYTPGASVGRPQAPLPATRVAAATPSAGQAQAARAATLGRLVRGVLERSLSGGQLVLKTPELLKQLGAAIDASSDLGPADKRAAKGRLPQIRQQLQQAQTTATGLQTAVPGKAAPSPSNEASAELYSVLSKTSEVVGLFLAGKINAAQSAAMGQRVAAETGRRAVQEELARIGDRIVRIDLALNEVLKPPGPTARKVLEAELRKEQQRAAQLLGLLAQQLGPSRSPAASGRPAGGQPAPSGAPAGSPPAPGPGRAPAGQVRIPQKFPDDAIYREIWVDPEGGRRQPEGGLVYDRSLKKKHAAHGAYFRGKDQIVLDPRAQHSESTLMREMVHEGSHRQRHMERYGHIENRASRSERKDLDDFRGGRGRHIERFMHNEAYAHMMSLLAQERERERMNPTGRKESEILEEGFRVFRMWWRGQREDYEDQVEDDWEKLKIEMMQLRYFDMA